MSIADLVYRHTVTCKRRQEKSIANIPEDSTIPRVFQYFTGVLSILDKKTANGLQGSCLRLKRNDKSVRALNGHILPKLPQGTLSDSQGTLSDRPPDTSRTSSQLFFLANLPKQHQTTSNVLAKLSNQRAKEQKEPGSGANDNEKSYAPPFPVTARYNQTLPIKPTAYGKIPETRDRNQGRTSGGWVE